MSDDFASDLNALDILHNIDLLRNVRAPIEARRNAADYLAQHPNKVALPVMIKALDDPDFAIRKSALLACEKFSSPLALDALVKVLHERTFSEREDAVRILGKIGDKRALQPLADAMLISDWVSIRSEAALALGKMGNPDSVDPLLEALQDFEAPVRAAAAEALGQIGDERAVEALITALKQESGWNMRHISKALAAIGQPAMMPLVNLLADQDAGQEFREIAAETLADITVTLPDASEAQTAIKLTVDLLVAELPTRESGVRNHIARNALTLMSLVVSEQLIQAFANSDQGIRDQVAYILGDSKNPALNERLIRALHVANDRVAAGAARVLYFRGINPRDHGYTGTL